MLSSVTSYNADHSSAAAKVFGTAELAEMILLFSSPAHIFRMRGLSKFVRATIQNSTKLREKLFLEADPDIKHAQWVFETLDDVKEVVSSPEDDVHQNSMGHRSHGNPLLTMPSNASPCMAVFHDSPRVTSFGKLKAPSCRLHVTILPPELSFTEFNERYSDVSKMLLTQPPSRRCVCSSALMALSGPKTWRTRMVSASRMSLLN